MEQEIRKLLDAKHYREAFERLLACYQTKVFRLAYSMFRNETLAEDAAQEIFMRIWKALPGFKGEASLSTWIYTISRNTCLSQMKKNASRKDLSFDETKVRDEMELLHSPQDGQDREIDVQRLLSRLPEKYRQVITLFYLEEKSYEEVAAMLHLPLGTVKTYLHRARKELAAFVAPRSSVHGKYYGETI